MFPISETGIYGIMKLRSIFPYLFYGGGMEGFDLSSLITIINGADQQISNLSISSMHCSLSCEAFFLRL